LSSEAGTIIGATVAAIFGLFFLIIFFHLISQIKIVEKGTAVVVERWGKFHRKLEPGFHFLIPFAERTRVLTWRWLETYYDYTGQEILKYSQGKFERIDLRETVMDFPLQSIITRDNVEILIHPMLLYRISDPVRAVYEVYDLSHAVEKLVQTTLRSVIGDMGLDDTLASREEINRTMKQKISNVFQNWGFKLLKVELLEINPGRVIQEAMHKQIAAERLRRASIISADGYREQMKTEAEGECQSVIALSKGSQQVSIITAKGHADAKVLKANAEGEAVRLISASLKEFSIDPTHYLIGLRYIETLTTLALNATNRLIYFPFETDVIGSVNELGD